LDFPSIIAPMSHPDPASKPSPAGWPRISSAIFYEDAGRAIDWLCSTFGFEVRLRIEGADGRIEHSELTFGEGLIMVGSVGGKSERKGGLPTQSPRSLGGVNTQMLCVFVDDVDAHAAHARAAGATIVDEPTTTDHGEDYWADRSYRVVDLEGHQWFFMQRVREQTRPLRTGNK
jgi:uncharacterized glyoxalase superfamily protein PhnB